ncbi:MAG TPA: SRPBCC family protein [Methylocystis sp.]|nr:SRPBCC family protein [Methylocystis sp.]
MWGVLLVLLYFGLALMGAVIVMAPDRFRVTREGVVDAPPARVFALINELRSWEGWSPWAKLDPRRQMTYSGPAAGAGATLEWSGDAKVGAGRLTIADSRPNEAIDIKLEFFRPRKALNDAFFRLTPEGSGTRVAWTITGRLNLVAKVTNLINSSCDKMIGPQFEQGLANLNALCGAASRAG